MHRSGECFGRGLRPAAQRRFCAQGPVRLAAQRGLRGAVPYLRRQGAAPSGKKEDTSDRKTEGSSGDRQRAKN